MKKVVLGLIALLSFTACNKNDFDYSPQEAVTAKYNDVFTTPLVAVYIMASSSCLCEIEHFN